MDLFNSTDSHGILSLFQDTFPTYSGSFLEVIHQWPNCCWFALKNNAFYSFHQDTLNLLNCSAEHLVNKSFSECFSNLIMSVDPISEYLDNAHQGNPQLFYVNFEFEKQHKHIVCYEVFLFKYDIFEGEEFLVGGIRNKGDLCETHFSSFPNFEQQIKNTLDVGIWAWDPITNNFSANKVVHSIYQDFWPELQGAEVKQAPFWQQSGELSLHRLKAYVEKHVAEGEDFEFRYLLPTKSGVKHIQERGIVTERDGRAVVLGTTQNITGTSQLINKAKQAWMVFENTNEAILITGEDGSIIDINPAAERLMGYSLEELATHTPKIFKSGIQDAAFYKRMWQSLINKGSWEGDIWNRKKDGTLIPLRQSINAISNELGERFYISIFHDISSRKEQESILKQQVYTDKLTGLANRDKLNFEIDQLLRNAKQGDIANVAVLFLDLDGFKRINDSYGHDLGDITLVEAARRMAKAVGEDNVLGRQGGDEFIAAIGFNFRSELDAILTELLACFHMPFKVSTLELYLSISVGVSISPLHSSSRSELIKYADTAMYSAKELGKNQIQFYDLELTQKVQRLLTVENELRAILSKHEAEFHYQPIVTIAADASYSLKGYESLARWPSNAKFKASTLELIECAEKSGLILDLTKELIADAVNVMQRLELDSDITMSLNISSDDLNAANFAKEFIALFKGKEAFLQRLELEVTETSLMDDYEHAAGQLKLLKKQGVTFAIDDFGTGYSSMIRLHELPIDVLKIDRSFVTGVDKSSAKQQMLEGMIALAKALELKVVAEGVETIEEHQMIAKLGCDFGQGYLYGRPKPELDFG